LLRLLRLRFQVLCLRLLGARRPLLAALPRSTALLLPHLRLLKTRLVTKLLARSSSLSRLKHNAKLICRQLKPGGCPSLLLHPTAARPPLALPLGPSCLQCLAYQT
jgi:hypothetical protein